MLITFKLLKVLGSMNSFVLTEILVELKNYEGTQNNNLKAYIFLLALKKKKKLIYQNIKRE